MHFDHNKNNEQIFQSNSQISPCVSNHSIIIPPTQVPKMKIRVDDHQGKYLLKTKQAKPCLLMYE
jgi:hypothetical protein